MSPDNCDKEVNVVSQEIQIWRIRFTAANADNWENFQAENYGALKTTLSPCKWSLFSILHSNSKHCTADNSCRNMAIVVWCRSFLFQKYYSCKVWVYLVCSYSGFEW